MKADFVKYSDSIVRIPPGHTAGYIVRDKTKYAGDRLYLVDGCCRVTGCPGTLPELQGFVVKWKYNGDKEQSPRCIFCWQKYESHRPTMQLIKQRDFHSNELRRLNTELLKLGEVMS